MEPHYKLLTQYTPTQTEYEAYDGSGGHHVAILAVFDHDWEQHLLVKQCSTGTVAHFLGMDRWEYRLYYRQNDMIVHIRTFFDADRTPWTEAAEMIACWTQHGHYGGTQNAIESDSFDQPRS